MIKIDVEIPRVAPDGTTSIIRDAFIFEDDQVPSEEELELMKQQRLEQLFAPRPPVTYVLDENGDPMLDENGHMIIVRE